MQIEKEVQAVKRLFNQIEKSKQKFLEKTPLQCPTGCAKCCHGKNVSATPLEFLPYAWQMYLEDKLEDVYWQFKTESAEHCFLLETYDKKNNLEQCSHYEHRGLVCRLFGNAAMLNKNGEKLLSGCSILKEKITDKTSFNIQLQQHAPVYSECYSKLRGINLQYGSMQFPINKAILKSLEVVYYNTHRKRKRIS